MPRILIIGKSGQLATALSRQLGASAMTLSRADCDLWDDAQLAAAISDTPLDAIINAAAYTAVDKAETDVDAAYQANERIPAALARYCKARGLPLIHYSTDYVFPGDGSAPYVESDPTGPLNVYGKSKLAGEQAIAASGCEYLIFRTSWVYDHTHSNFLTTMLRLGSEREELSVVDDQIGAPTFAEDIAGKTLEVLNKIPNKNTIRSGIYHLVAAGETSWYAYADAIFSLGRTYGLPLKIKTLKPIPSSAYPTPAKRPLNSRLDCSKAKSILNIEMPDWHASLEKCMEKAVENYRNAAQRSAGS